MGLPWILAGRRAFLRAALLLFGVLTACPAWALKLSVTPAIADVVVKAGATGAVPISVSNSGERAINITVYPWDLWYTDEEWVAYTPASGRERSAALWIEAVPQEFRLEPGASKVVSMQVSVPPDATGGYYAMAFVQSEAAKDDGVTTVVPRGRLGVQVRITVDGSEPPEARLDGVRLYPPTPSVPMRADLLLANTGSVHFKPAFKALVRRTPDGEIVGRFGNDASAAAFLPGQTGPVTGRWPGELPAGTYQLVGVLMLDTDVASLPFQQDFVVDDAGGLQLGALVGAATIPAVLPDVPAESGGTPPPPTSADPPDGGSAAEEPKDGGSPP